MPPISSRWIVSGSKESYSYNLPGIYMPQKTKQLYRDCNRGENLNVGVRKEQVSGGTNQTRIWVSTWVLAGSGSIATTDSDQLSPGTYHLKIFGDVADNVTKVGLQMTAVKKLVINGAFNLTFNNGGYPSGNYSINAKALNGTFSFDEISIDGLTLGP